MTHPALYRRRFIPDEIINLKHDNIVYIDESLIKTEWQTIKPRDDFSHGISWYFLERGFKVSKFFKETGCLHYIYCDIIEYEYRPSDNSYIFSDLLVDVIVNNNGTVHVLDIAEIAEALDASLITLSQAKDALTKLDALLKIIYEGKLLDLIEGI